MRYCYTFAQGFRVCSYDMPGIGCEYVCVVTCCFLRFIHFDVFVCLNLCVLSGVCRALQCCMKCDNRFSRHQSDVMFFAGFSSYCVKYQLSYGDGGSLMHMVMTAMNETGA